MREDKDIVEKIDEFFAPFMVGVAAGRKGGSSGGRVKGGKIDDLYLDVLYSKEKDIKKATELIIKDKKLDKKTAKQLRKYVKKHS